MNAGRRCVFSAIGIAVLAGGCQRYEPRPLDLAGHREAFFARTPDSPEVSAFAASLAVQPDEGDRFDLQDGVSWREGEAVALVFNADLRIARLRAGVTRAGVEHAGLWEDPTIGVDLTRIIQSVENPWKLAASIGFTIPISGRLEAEQARAGAEHAAELARLAEMEWSTRMELRRGWARWSALAIKAETTREFLTRVAAVVDIMDKMEAAGEVARTEARLFRVERLTRAAGLAQIEAELAQAEIDLREIMGLSPGAAVTFTPATMDGSSAEGVGSIADDALGERNPGMLVAKAEYEVAERALRLEVRKQYPDLMLGPGYGNDDGNDEVLLGIALPLPILNANRRGIAEAEAAREVARVNAEAALERLTADVARARVQMDAARARREVLHSEIVPMVDAQYADAREIARLGEVNTLLLLETLSRQQEAKEWLIDARRDESLAVIRLQELTGPNTDPDHVIEGGQR